MSTRNNVTRAIAALLSTTLLGGCAAQVAASKQAAAINRGAPEKCFGIARSGRNDCRTAAHICAGWAHQDGDPHAFVYLPTGTCDRIVGGLTDPTSSSPRSTP
jgi:uncharacterized membrane protein